MRNNYGKLHLRFGELVAEMSLSDKAIRRDPSLPTCVSDKKTLKNEELGLAGWIAFSGEEDGALVGS